MKFAWTFGRGYSFHDVWSFVQVTLVTETGLYCANCREPTKLLVMMKILH